jgi:hypothetical protein
MKKALFTVAAVAALGAYASSASAQCSFNEPGKAKGLKSSLVKAYAACPGITFAAPNSGTMAGVPGCATPFALSAYKFEALKGKCDIKTGQKLENPCSTGNPLPCANLSLSLKCSGVLNADGVTPNNQAGWNLNTVARATFDDTSNGDMTVIDFPAQFPLPQASGGKFSGKFTTNQLLIDLFGNGSELPGCTAIQIIRLAVADPAGNTFATMGSSSR